MFRTAPLTLSLVLAAAGCIDDAAVESTTETANPETPAAIDRDRILAETAQELAWLLHDANLRAALRTQLALRVTGDYEVLIDSLRDLELEDGRRLGDVMHAAAALDHVHIAAPLGLAAWTDAETPIVTFAADDDATELVYFDVSGLSTRRPADEQPTGPVLVVGINERIGYGKKTAETMPYVTNAVYLRDLVIWDDKEPWTKGDPEIYMKCMGSIKFDLPDVNEEGKTYRFNKYITTTSDTQITCEVKESDGSDGDDRLNISYFWNSNLSYSTDQKCYGSSKNEYLLGVSRVKGYETVELWGETVTVDAGCPYYFF